jgi:hypothetical protein
MEKAPRPEMTGAIEPAIAETSEVKAEAKAEHTPAEATKDGAAGKPEEKESESHEAAIKEAVANVDKEIAAAGVEASKAEAKEQAKAKEAAENGTEAPKKQGFVEKWKAAQSDWMKQRYGNKEKEKCPECGATGGGGAPSGFFKGLFKFAKMVLIAPLVLLGGIHIAVDSAIKRLDGLLNGKKK